MVHWWEIGLPDADAPALVRAVAYYRHSPQDRQENSIPIQQDQVRAWAKENGVEIIREFCDAGRSGLNSEGRPAFTEMMDGVASCCSCGPTANPGGSLQLATT